MGSSSASYRKPAQSTSGNSPLDSPHELLPLAEASNIHPRRRMVLVAMLKCNRFAVVGSRNELFPATLTVSVMLGLPSITVRRAIDALEKKDKVLALVKQENWIDEKGDCRRPRTYQVVPENLRPRMTLAEHRKLRFHNKRKKEVPIVPISTPPLPQREKPAAEHRSNSRTLRKLTPREGPRLVNEVLRLMKGVKGQTGVDRLWVEYRPDDARYREPMSQEAALNAACANLGIPYESAKEHLKLCRFGEPESEGPQ